MLYCSKIYPGERFRPERSPRPLERRGEERAGGGALVMWVQSSDSACTCWRWLHCMKCSSGMMDQSIIWCDSAQSCHLQGIMFSSIR